MSAASVATPAEPTTTTPTPRTVYLRATDAEAGIPGGRLLDEIRAELLRTTVPDDTLDALIDRAAQWSTGEAGRLGDLTGHFPTETDRAVLVRRTALGCAPLALHSGAWLQWLSSSGNGDDPTVLRMLALYAHDVGVGNPHASRGDAYLALLRHLKLSENAVPAGRLVGDQRVDDGHFFLPALLLAMSRRPEDFTPEILGADLCLRAVGLLPALTLLRAELPTAADWDIIDPATGRGESGESALALCRATVDSLVAAEGPAVAEAVRLGFRWALSGLTQWSERLFSELDTARNPAFEMAELMRLRSREGAVYHQTFQLDGRPLADWLRECATDPYPMLDALSRSRLIKPGRPEKSPLVTGLVGERGRMFRVFSPEDLAVVRRWIGFLGAPADGDARGDRNPHRALPAPPRLALPSWAAAGQESDRAPADLREAYHQLLRRTGSPALRRWATAYVHGWLGRSRHGIDRSEMPLPARWTPRGLRGWLAEMHDRHSEEFERDGTQDLPERAALVDATVQQAPLTLIDGAWIQGFTDYAHASSQTGHSLFDTYWDELGNGEAHLNHPLIYREVLDEMDVDLPPTASREFAQWEGFRDASFELPVYWLSIGRFPQTFLPEVLGLNLAMELSGVGGSYRRARLALKQYGFSTRFVDIHNTVDNVATGHSAWAADAIDTYLSSLTASQGEGALAPAWERIRTGYRSLNPPSGFLARKAGRRAAHLASRSKADR
ncbi:iron-containing redox enzyme family protein [Streptomyces sp. NPDC048483]|uniref:iron-containing redox enzyme family protein n=1 Tax=Streptomyces sp. NPDC048483 TaxID=3154927 RepID=UPI0034212FA1